MGKIFVLLGKSGSGKSTLQKRILRRLPLKNVISCTTRPMRDREIDGRDYHFMNMDTYNAKFEQKDIICCRTYDTVFGVWKYGISRETINSTDNYLCVVDCDGYRELVDSFGKESVVGIYITLKNSTRLIRSIVRSDETDVAIDEIIRRYKDDNMVFKGIEHEVQFIIENDHLSQVEDCIVEFMQTLL